MNTDALADAAEEYTPAMNTPMIASVQVFMVQISNVLCMALCAWGKSNNMAPGRIQRPGTGYGPCHFEGCGHKDCDATRQIANSICQHCEQAIGYERGFYHLGNGSYVHSSCHMDAIALAKEVTQ